MNYHRSTNIRENRSGPAQVFLQRTCSGEFCKIHRKKPVLESLFTKFASGTSGTLLKTVYR